MFKKFRKGLLANLLRDHAHDVGFLHDQEILTINAHLGAGPLAEQDAVAGFHVEGDNLAALVTGTGADGDDLALLRLLLGGVRDDDAALGLLFSLNTADDDAVVQRTEFHGCASSIWNWGHSSAPSSTFSTRRIGVLRRVDTPMLLVRQA